MRWHSRSRRRTWGWQLTCFIGGDLGANAASATVSPHPPAYINAKSCWETGNSSDDGFSFTARNGTCTLTTKGDSIAGDYKDPAAGEEPILW